MKILVIPDVHLKPWIFSKAEEVLKNGGAERAVCLMDIADDWDMEENLALYRETFDTAISFAKRFPKTIWCRGNHDFSYLWGRRHSGYSDSASTLVQVKVTELQETVVSLDIMCVNEAAAAVEELVFYADFSGFVPAVDARSLKLLTESRKKGRVRRDVK